ncbi:ATP-binding protein [Virgibacillus sp. W0181]|uniref:ATP-binding protein n=1 Tax=Virgibacillus sp. W0181 TaxID=3391581 RepID=UPI003F4547F0
MKIDTVENDFTNLATLPDVILEWLENTNTDMILCVGNNSGEILFVSQSIQHILGYNKVDFLGRQWQNKVSEKTLSYILNFSKDNSSTKDKSNTWIIGKNGQKVYLEGSLKKIVDHTNNTTYVVAALKDLTKQLEADRVVIHSEQMAVAGQLAAGVAHEIRNPLTSIKGFLQLLQAGVNRKEEYYKIMIDEVEKMESVTSELLNISKPLTEDKQIETIGPMIEDVLLLLKSQATLKNVEFIFKANDSYDVYCDRSQIKQVLINLVKNGIEASNSNGKITICVKGYGPHIAIDIIDEGIGIPDELINKLGQPFFTTKDNGTGLGLMITKQILQCHEGDLKIIKNKDKGSTFRIILPKYKGK